MDIHVLGPVEASVDGRLIAIGAGKPRALLAMLALNAEAPVSVERLLDGLWGEEPPATAPKMVQVYVSQLRKALAASPNGAEIVTRGRGYELRLGSGELDARRFERLVASGAPRDALALWRGPPLGDVADEPFAAPEIRRLEELRLTAIELAIEHDLATGRDVEAIGELEALVAQEPLRERLHAQRMLALYRSGRQADALEAYREARAALVEAVGVEPGPELRRLHEAILRQDPALEPPAARASELDVRTPLVGREAELEWLRERWRKARDGAGGAVLVTGARGIGKTRLVAELAAEVSRGGGEVLRGLATPDGARGARRPTLVVLDDLDRADGGAVEDVAGQPVLVVATAQDDALAERLGAATLELGPLDGEGVRAIVMGYVRGSAGTAVPVERLLAASAGIPERVHETAAAWARTEAASRLDHSAGRAARERTGLRAAEDDLAGDVVELQALAQRAGPRDAGSGVVVCPFKGLASFEVEDARFFFGRERLVGEMVARLAGAPLMGIVGPSGSGKSSALRAGLLPALTDGVLPGSEGWAQALLRPGEHPNRALELAVAGAAPRGRLVVAVDQFEELFTACRSEPERARFADALVACARDPRRRALVLVAVRADFYGRCASYPELWRLLGANQLPVGPMRRDELRRAIESPARRAGLEVEPELVDALVADVEGEPGALPMLSTSLLELWQERDGRRLRLAAYEHAGGVQGAVARLAERAYERLGPEQRPVARRILLRLAGDEQGDAVVRRRVPLAELDGDGTTEVLAALADARLVTVGEGEAEVAHEALLREWPRLRGWLQEDAEGRRLHQHLGAAAREWEAGGRDPGELYRGARLVAALDWSATHHDELNPTERAFADESRAASGRSHRRLRAVLAGVAALLVLAVIAGAVALHQRGAARAKATAAEAQRLGAQALVEDDLDRSLLLARQGVALDDSVQTRGNLFAALLKAPAAIGVWRGEGERMWQLALSPDGRTLAAGDPAGKLYLFDTGTRRRVATLKPAPADPWITQLAFSPEGTRLAVGHDSRNGNLVSILDLARRRFVRRLYPPRGRFLTALRYSSGGAALDLVSVPFDPAPGPSLFERFDPRTGRVIVRPTPVNRGDQSPLLAMRGGRRLITAGAGEVVVRDAATLQPVKRLAVPGANAEPGAYALSPDDRTLAVGREDGSVRFVDLRDGSVRTASDRHRGPVTSAAFTPDGRTLVTGGQDGDVIVWDVRRAAAGETLSGHASGVQALAVAPDGATVYTAGLDGAVFTWDLVGARRMGRPFTAGAGDANAVAVSSDGRTLARGLDDGAVRLVDLRTLARGRPFPVVPGGESHRVRFVPGSRLLVVGGPNGFWALVDSATGRIVRRLRGHRGNPYVPGLSADGRLLATAGDDNTVRLWSLPDGRPLGAPIRIRPDLAATALSPDGRTLTATRNDLDREHSTVEIWDVRSRRRVRSLRLPGQIDGPRFSPDGRLAAIDERFGRTQVWSTATWTPVTRWLGGDASGILLDQISPDDRTLATGSQSGVVRLWDIPSQQAVSAPLPGPHTDVVALFTPDGTHLIANYATGRAILWDIRPGSFARRACRIAGRRLTRAEWDEFLPGRPYDPAC